MEDPFSVLKPKVPYLSVYKLGFEAHFLHLKNQTWLVQCATWKNQGQVWVLHLAGVAPFPVRCAASPACREWGCISQALSLAELGHIPVPCEWRQACRGWGCTIWMLSLDLSAASGTTKHWAWCCSQSLGSAGMVFSSAAHSSPIPYEPHRGWGWEWAGLSRAWCSVGAASSPASSPVPAQSSPARPLPHSLSAALGSALLAGDRDEDRLGAWLAWPHRLWAELTGELQA